MKKNDYRSVMDRDNEIMKDALAMDYSKYESGNIAFDYEGLMADVNLSIEEIKEIQLGTGVGNTPLLELKNITALARKTAPAGKGARIFVKDEQCNPSGSFKDRRASISAYMAKKMGYKGIMAATSGNYGAAVASQAAMLNLPCIIVQECFDSKKIGQPEILEKQRKCESYGAEVLQLTVGPELFYVYLKILEETNYFNASLYSNYGIAGVETLGTEIIEEMRAKEGKEPDVIIATNAGGGNLTGTARGALSVGASTKIFGASVDLSGLSMASDSSFNKKSFTTGHTGFGMPYATDPDHSDVPRSAARPLRYMDDYLLVKQGEVFYITEALAQLEGLERGPAGNTSLTAAFALAQTMDEDQIIVVQETEYTGAGKSPQPQLSFAIENGISVKFGNPNDEIPGETIILPEHPSNIEVRHADLDRMRKSYIRKAVEHVGATYATQEDISYLALETRSKEEYVSNYLAELKIKIN
ncbi:2-amino-4-oxopentanoate thiolase subunit OrtB [Vagococcus salmoninarum]|nr:2-amino-4-oxopentanoate thiolase subunit OrtB [Vagococcus salmoninarum]